VYRDVLALAACETFGDVVDVGCGRGQLAVALRQAGLACAAETADMPEATTVLLIDVLYQREPEVQIALLQAVAGAARQRVGRAVRWHRYRQLDR
jgi:2-polyprenyl-3-methyl-5-hydroxy-6-metoxy-1,4-benzoquinol methylase